MTFWLLFFTVVGFFVQILGITPYISSIYWEWINAGQDKMDSFLYIPPISPIVKHWQALVQGKYIDFWLYFVWSEYGLWWVIYAAILPTTYMFCCGRKIWKVVSLRESG